MQTERDSSSPELEQKVLGVWLLYEKEIQAAVEPETMFMTLVHKTMKDRTYDQKKLRALIQIIWKRQAQRNTNESKIWDQWLVDKDENRRTRYAIELLATFQQDLGILDLTYHTQGKDGILYKGNSVMVKALHPDMGKNEYDITHLLLINKPQCVPYVQELKISERHRTRFIIMHTYLSGDVIRPLLKNNRECWYQLIDHLHTLHHEGVVHMDLHEKNILCDPVTKKMYWSDFGSAELRPHTEKKQENSWWVSGEKQKNPTGSPPYFSRHARKIHYKTKRPALGFADDWEVLLYIHRVFCKHTNVQPLVKEFLKDISDLQQQDGTRWSHEDDLCNKIRSIVARTSTGSRTNKVIIARPVIASVVPKTTKTTKRSKKNDYFT